VTPRVKFPFVNRPFVNFPFLNRPFLEHPLVTPILDPDRIERCRGTAAAAGNWSAPPPRGVGAPSPARSTS